MATIQSLAQIPSRAMQFLGEVFSRVDAAHQPALFDRTMVILQGREGLSDHIFGSGPHAFARLFYTVAEGEGRTVPSQELKRMVLCALVPHVEELAQVAGFSERLTELKAIDLASPNSSKRSNPVPWWFAHKFPRRDEVGVVSLQEGHLGVGAGAIAMARLNDMRAQVEEGKQTGTIPDGSSLEPHLVAVPHGLYDTVLINVFGRSPTKKGLEGMDMNSPGRLKIKALLPQLGAHDYFVINTRMKNGPILKVWREKKAAGTLSSEDESEVTKFVQDKYQTLRGVRDIKQDGERTVLVLRDGTERILESWEKLYPQPGSTRETSLTDQAFATFQSQIMGVPSDALPSVLSRDNLRRKPPGTILSFDQKSFLPPNGELIPVWVGDQLKRYRPDILALFVEGLNFAVMSFLGEARHLEIASEYPTEALRLGMAMAGARLSSRFMTVVVSPHIGTGAVGSAGKNMIALDSGVRLVQLMDEAYREGHDAAWIQARHWEYLRERRGVLKEIAKVYGIDPTHPFSTAVLDDYDGTTGMKEGMIQYPRLFELYQEIVIQFDTKRVETNILEFIKQMRSRNVTVAALLELGRQMVLQGVIDNLRIPRELRHMTAEGVKGIINVSHYVAHHGSKLPASLASLYRFLWEMGEVSDPPEGPIATLRLMAENARAYPWPPATGKVEVHRLRILARRSLPLFRSTREGLQSDLSLDGDIKAELDRIEADLLAIQTTIGWIPQWETTISLPEAINGDLTATLDTMLRLNLRFTPGVNYGELVAQLGIHVRGMKEKLSFLNPA